LTGSAPSPPARHGTLAERIATIPHLGCSQRAQARLAEWLGATANTRAGAGVAALLKEHPIVRSLLASLAEFSPYLWRLARDDPDRLLRVLHADPEVYLAARLIESTKAVAAACDDATAMRLLRHLKVDATLLIALLDIGGVFEVTRITRALTEVADHTVGAAVRFVLASAIADGKLKSPDPDQPDRGCGYFVLAMGKMGAWELNFSSDIDLMVFFNPAASAVTPDLEPAPLFVRLTRRVVKLLQERTSDGYVFRVDLRLRPDPASTQIAISTDSALSYYESRGQNWERAALIKARPCAGDLATGEAFLRELSPFIWRKYLDYAAIADIHAMKRQIHAYRGHGEIAVEGHNIKLGRGGIREIEFFVQTQQLITGGRHPELHGRETLSTLARLQASRFIGAEAARDLARAYVFLRRVEHRLQMVADEQTHTLPSEAGRLMQFARFLGYSGRDAFAETLITHLRNVQHHYAALFEDGPRPIDQPVLLFRPEADDPATLEKLNEMGFHQPLAVSSTVRQWLSGSYPALKGEVAKIHLLRLLPQLIDRFARTDAPDRTLVAFDRFLSGLHGGARLLSLLRRNTELIGLLALTLGAAPRLADIVALYPQAMDGLIDPSFFGALPDASKLQGRLAHSLEQASSYEDLLDRVRMFGHEHLVLIGARILSGTLSAEQAGEAFARLADVLVQTLHHTVKDAFRAGHGQLRGAASAILALGKLGGREMTAGSDLDLILVYDFDREFPDSDGPRPLPGPQYFARLTQRLISALGAPTNYGSLYKVDLRLRPSGRSGPVATDIGRFKDYQEHEAWTWEHMALTRARVISAPPQFAARIKAVIRDVLCRERDPELVAADLLEMRQAIALEKGDADPWDLKHVAGGLIDIEFTAQYLQLIHAAAVPDILDSSTIRALDNAWRLGFLADKDAEVLRPAARLYHNLTQLLRLCLSRPFAPNTAGSELLGLLARVADVPDFGTLEAHLAETRTQVRASFLRVLSAG
jgi:[glutamine synthetase] adenylyltransferase / [glutamine synthetase]-adenylyl-L-tyrosine phosphorylase